MLSVWPHLLLTAGQQQAIDFSIFLHCHQAKHESLNRCISPLQRYYSCTSKISWVGLFGRMFFSSLSHPCSILLKRGDGENSPFGFGISIWTGGTGLLGEKNVREFLRNYLMTQVLLMGALLSHPTAQGLYSFCYAFDSSQTLLP